MKPPTTAPDDPAGGLPGWIWVVYVALFGASIPWYLPEGPVAIWLGLPYWVVVSLGAIAGVSAFTVFVVHRYWRDEDGVA